VLNKHHKQNAVTTTIIVVIITIMIYECQSIYIRKLHHATWTCGR